MFTNPLTNLELVLLFVAVAMQRERDELVDAPYRRDFLTYDNHLLDGEMFLQVRPLLLLLLLLSLLLPLDYFSSGKSSDSCSS